MVCLSGSNLYSNCGYALVMYYMPILYCVYALVGRAISILDLYICTVHQSVPTNHKLSSTGLLSVQ